MDSRETPNRERRPDTSAGGASAPRQHGPGVCLGCPTGCPVVQDDEEKDRRVRMSTSAPHGWAGHPRCAYSCLGCEMQAMRAGYRLAPASVRVVEATAFEIRLGIPGVRSVRS